MVTLWPSFPHFPRFAVDNRLSGIRLNSAMMSNVEIAQELELIKLLKLTVPLFFDVKGRQLRVTKVHPNTKRYLDISLNHPISCNAPTPVLFKAGEDTAVLRKVVEGGTRLIFDGGPEFNVREGESLHIRDSTLRVSGPQFTDAELEKIALVKEFGFRRFFLSYVQSKEDVAEFVDLVGSDAMIYLKIEDEKGLNYVRNDFARQPNLKLVAACGDLFVEVKRPHEILNALRLIIEKDPEACVGSRLLLSVIREPVPSLADLAQVAWLYDIGYRTFLLCDELCLKESLLAPAVNIFDGLRSSYQA